VPATAAKAPNSISPSSEMLITPDRSEKSPPMPAKTSGTADRKVAVNNAMEKKSKKPSSSVLLTHWSDSRFS
jgi:hypothetical protein